MSADTVIFHCARCDTPLSNPVQRVALPFPDLAPPYYRSVGRIPYGAYAIEQGWVLNPADVANTVLLGDRCDGGCCGATVEGGPNLACRTCGALVATSVDDCDHWREVRLRQAGVVPAGGPSHAPLPSRVSPAFPGAREWREREELAAWSARFKAAAGTGPLFLAEGPLHRCLAVPSRTLPAVRDVSQWRAAAAAAGLTPRLLATSPVTVADLAGRDRPFSRGLTLLRRWCEEERVRPAELRLLAIVPGDEPADHVLDGLPVHTVRLAAFLWERLAIAPVDTARCLARVRWGHQGIAELVHRDEDLDCAHGRLTSL